MDGPRQVLELIRDRQMAGGRLRGVFHLLIGRTIAKDDGTVLSNGVTWRELSQWLKLLKFDRALVKELDADPESLSPKDREKFWYVAITLAKVDSDRARREADEVAALLKPLGFSAGGSPAVRAAKPAPEKNPMPETTEQTPTPLSLPAVKRKKK